MSWFWVIWVAILLLALLLCTFLYICIRYLHQDYVSKYGRYPNSIYSSMTQPGFVDTPAARNPLTPPELGFGLPVSMPQPEAYQTTPPSTRINQSSHLGFGPPYPTEDISYPLIATPYPPEQQEIRSNVLSSCPYPVTGHLNNQISYQPDTNPNRSVQSTIFSPYPASVHINNQTHYPPDADLYRPTPLTSTTCSAPYPPDVSEINQSQAPYPTDNVPANPNVRNRFQDHTNVTSYPLNTQASFPSNDQPPSYAEAITQSKR